MALKVKPNPRGPRRKMTGGFRLLMTGDSSRHGDVSRLLAVLLDPPGDWIDLADD